MILLARQSFSITSLSLATLAMYSLAMPMLSQLFSEI